MAGRFVAHLLRRQTAEFFVNDREKFGGGFWITVLHPFQICVNWLKPSG
jgi:hypothetical protein